MIANDNVFFCFSFERSAVRFYDLAQLLNVYVTRCYFNDLHN